MDSPEHILIKELARQVKDLYSVHFFQSKSIDTIALYFADKISKLNGEDKNLILEELNKMRRVIYDKAISDLEKWVSIYCFADGSSFPIQELENDNWYFPQED